MKSQKLFFYIFLFCFPFLFKAQVLDISKPTQLESLKPYLKIYADSLSNINLGDLHGNSAKLNFKAFDKSLIDSELQTHWLKLEITNPTSLIQTKYIGLGDITEYITIYVFKNDILINTIYSGANIPVDKREIKIGRDNIISITIPPFKTYEYFIKIENKLPFTKQFLKFMSEYFIVYSPAFFDKNYTKGRILNSFYYGAIFIMFFYNLILAISLKSKEYYAYILFVAAFFVFNIFSDGYPSETFLSHLPYRDRILRIFVAPVTFVAYIYFSRIYLKTQIFTPKADKFYLVFIALLLGCYIPIFMNYWWQGRNAMTYILITFIAYFAIISVVCYRKGYKPAIYYIAGNALLLLSGLSYSLYLLAIIPHNGYTRVIEYLPQIASIIELAIFSLGLSHRIKIAEHEKAVAQAKTIELFSENEKTMVKQKELLEENVKMRTEELRSANLDLNASNAILNKLLHQVEKEKEKSDQLLLNILPESIAIELKENGYSKPCQYESVSILFADLVNFTEYASKHPPEEVTQKLDALFFEFDKICSANQLEKIKTIGDCYMAAGGLPIVNKTNAIDAVNAATELIKSVENSGWQLRIGIHTGPVVAGVIGVNKFAYDVWGDTVNIASRLETTSDSNRINISKETYSIVNHLFKCSNRGKISAKNKGEIEMYFVESKIV